MKLAKKVSMILCDDIRMESGNKLSLMGIYGKEIILENPPPIVFPKLCLLIRLEETIIEIPSLKIKIFPPKVEATEINLDPPPNQKIGMEMNLGIVISPLKIDNVGDAKIEIYLEGRKKPILLHKFIIIKKR